MKVEGPGKTSNISRSRKKGGVGGADFDKMISESDQAQETKSAGAAAAVGNVDALLSLQGSGDFSESDSAQKEAHKRADTLLDELEQMRVGMLNGAVSRSNLVALARIIQTHRGKVLDPNLTLVLDEIDLRAQVELAKFTAKD